MSGFGPELANHARLRRQPGARGYGVGAYARNSENNENEQTRAHSLEGGRKYSVFRIQSEAPHAD